MKKSIFKKIVSVFAVAAMLVTGSVVALADYECASQESECNADKTNWTVDSYSGVNYGAKHTMTDGVLKSERSVFRTSSPASYGLSATGQQWIEASSDGKWQIVTATTSGTQYGETSNRSSHYVFADSQTFSKGKVQAKFDFKFDGSDGQCINVGFKDSTDNASNVVGIRIYKNNLRIWYPTDLVSSAYYYNNDKTALTDGEWYTCTILYDIDASKEYVTITNADGFSFNKSETISTTNWGKRTKGNVSGITFSTYRDFDTFGTTTSPEPASSVWYIDNVELDAGVGYKAENIYSTGDGMTSNVMGTGMNFDGIKLSRLTRLADPSDAKLITATYDSEGRMETAVATPLSAVGATPLNADVTGDTIKSFVLGMDTATPYMAPYTYTAPEKTERKIDFDGDYPTTVKKISSLTGDETHGYISAAGHTMSIASENGNDVLKSERSYFRLTGTPKYNYYCWFNPSTNAFEIKKGETGTGYYYVKLGETATSVKGSFKIKFAGASYASAQQDMQLNIGTIGSGSASEYYLRVTRYSDGRCYLMTKFNTTIASCTGMKANEWYTVNFDYDGTKMKADITGIFGDNTSETTVTGTAQQAAASPKASFDYVVFGSHRDMDKAAGYTVIDNATESYEPKETAVEGGINTSVYYIDDIVLEY